MMIKHLWTGHGQHRKNTAVSHRAIVMHLHIHTMKTEGRNLLNMFPSLCSLSNLLHVLPTQLRVELKDNVGLCEAAHASGPAGGRRCHLEWCCKSS